MFVFSCGILVFKPEDGTLAEGVDGGYRGW